MNHSDQQDNLPSPTQHQETIRTFYNEMNKDETDMTDKDEAVSKRKDDVRRNFALESYPPVINNNEPMSHIKNGGSSVADTTISVPEFPFSVTRLWICITLIISIYTVGLMTLGPLSSQYLVHYFSQGHDTTNASSSRGTCSNSTSLEDDFINTAQKKASGILLYSNIACNIPAFFTCIFAGSISDFVGRKVLLFIALSGLFIETTLLGIIIHFQLNVKLLYIGSALDGLSGFYFVTYLAVTAVITDVTFDGKSKAIRFVIIDGITLVLGALSELAVGYLIKAAGFFVPVLVFNCLMVVPLLVTIFLLPETLKQKQKFSWNVKMHIKKTFGFYFSKTKGSSLRLLFILGLVAQFTLVFADAGKSNIETLFVLNRPLCWNSVAIGIFGAVRMVVMSLAGVAALKVFKNRLSLEMTGIICGISATAGFFLEGFSGTTWMMYLSSVVGILFNAALSIPRALLSQIAPPDEQGALFSGMSCLETLVDLVSATIYINIYNATMDTFIGAAFMVIASMCLLHVVSLGMFRFLRISQGEDYEHLVEDPVNKKTDFQATGDEL